MIFFSDLFREFPETKSSKSMEFFHEWLWETLEFFPWKHSNFNMSENPAK